ncbi:MAG: hypothetical protein RBS38_10470 [Bacteroidales bacterium]|jgi:hypothetical protein|nr:hypothetical protein [Bacteroidales bacterium]
MEIHYDWKTKLFSKKFEIYQNDQLKGELFKEGLSRIVTGELNTKRFKFETKGFLKFETTITDLQRHIEAGKITFLRRKNDTIIHYKDRQYKWKFENFICSRWSLSDENKVLIKYHSNAFTGMIESYTTNELLILSGFYIRNYLRQRSAQIAAIS